jgi:UDP-N-acetyl-D-mannosaminuronic acid dehydrogenase
LGNLFVKQGVILKITIVGGCGHVGLPLAVSLASAGAEVISFDINPHAVNLVNGGDTPFFEEDLKETLQTVLGNNFSASLDPVAISSADVLIMIVGTPLDVHLNPDPNAVIEALAEILPYMKDGQLLILRSTVFPGVTRRAELLIQESKLRIDVSFCPERIVEGAAMLELRQLPQIIGARDEATFKKSQDVFDLLGVAPVRTNPEEAELAKLFTNTWRYIKFAAANQFWMMSTEAGIDYEKVRSAIRFEYPRANDLPGAGFAAGPCLFKDTMQLAAFTGNEFPLGNAAMLVNEGQPNFIVNKLKLKYPLEEMTVGILGMAFKGESDDARSSLAYKLKRILKFSAKNVLCTDPFVNDSSLVSIDQVLRDSDLLIIGAPHKSYKQLSSDKPTVDIWNILGEGSLL